MAKTATAPDVVDMTTEQRIAALESEVYFLKQSLERMRTLLDLAARERRARG